MSQTPPEAPTPLPEGTIRCARCGATVPPDAEWCLECGLAARTRVAPMPRWRIPVAIAATLVALALAALAVAFVDLTKDPEEPAATTAPATTAAPASPPTTPPAVTAPVPTSPPTTPPTTPTAPTTAPASPEGGAIAPPETTPAPSARNDARP